MQDIGSGSERACRTLQEAALFLGSGLGGRWGQLIDGPSRGKLLGNGLRELDRFLNLLIGEVAARCCDEAERDRLGRLRNTALKLEALARLLGRPVPELARLRAIARNRDCLFHCGGIVRRPDRRGGMTMAAGWPIDGAALALGTRLPLSAEDLSSVCGFYHALAGRMRLWCQSAPRA